MYLKNLLISLNQFAIAFLRVAPLWHSGYLRFTYSGEKYATLTTEGTPDDWTQWTPVTVKFVSDREADVMGSTLAV